MFLGATPIESAIGIPSTPVQWAGTSKANLHGMGYQSRYQLAVNFH